MEVIGAGWGRTGTLSLKTALDTLGLPCYHMKELFSNPGHAQQWIRAADGEAVDLASLLSGYKAATDWPTVAFYKQLMGLYPDAKVILTVRNPDSWYDSMKETVWPMTQAMLALPWYVKLIHKLRRPGADVTMVDRLVWQGDLQGCFERDPNRVRQLFQQHNEEVQQTVPADRLLVYEVSQGWEPLCAFLGKPVPDQPFPHENERQQWMQRVAFVKRLNAALIYGVPAVAAAIFAAVVAVVLGRFGRG